MDSVYVLQNGKELNKREFLGYVEKKVRKTIRVYRLITKKDKLLVVCYSNSSLVLLYILKKIFRKTPVEALFINLTQSFDTNEKIIKKFCSKLDIKLHKIISKSLIENCDKCKLLRKKIVNKKAEELKSKIVSDECLDNIAELIIECFNNKIENLIKLKPKADSVIRPLYFCSKEEIELYLKLTKIPKLNKCPYKKEKIELELNKLEKKYKGIKNGLVNSILKMLPVLDKF